MSHLKRKSLDASPDAHNDDNAAPSKRVKVEDEDMAMNNDAGGNDASPKRRSPSPGRRTSHSRRDSETSRKESVTVDRSSRNSFSQEEKKRGKRLFGGLLSTLSQTTNNSQQKRRQEVEKRQQERAAKQRIEDDKRRSERFAKLDKIRKVEQVRFDEQAMRTRHSHMRSMAHSLQTQCEPKLYYRPWQLTPEQEDVIKDQIRDVQVRIQDELQGFKRQKEQRLQEVGVVLVGEMVTDRSTVAAKDESASTTTDNKVSLAPSQEHDKDHDEMVEAEEDTVIY